MFSPEQGIFQPPLEKKEESQMQCFLLKKDVFLKLKLITFLKKEEPQRFLQRERKKLSGTRIQPVPRKGKWLSG